MDAARQVQIGQQHWAAGRFAEAAEAFRIAGDLAPGDPLLQANYGICLAKAGDLDRARPMLEELAPKLGNPELYFNLGNVYRLMLRLDDAVVAYVRGLALQPNHANLHWNRSHALLLAGKLAEGWPEFEWRFRLDGRKPMPFVGSAFNGSLDSVRGKIVIVGAEQGFGDTIQFARYIPILASAGAKMILVCQPELKELMRSVPGLSHVMSPGVDPIPRYELHAPLMSLPRLLGTTLDTIPATVPYLTADDQKRRHWRNVLSPFAQMKKVGVVWAGRPTHTNDPNRSMRLEDFAPLAKLSNVKWISLQKGPAALQLKTVPFGSAVLDCGYQLTDFADAAALIAELDLVISVDTAIVHLAGALAKPVWTLLPHLPDWRWLLDRVDSPWYPTMKLFRQPSPGRWEPVIEEACRRLSSHNSNVI